MDLPELWLYAGRLYVIDEAGRTRILPSCNPTLLPLDTAKAERVTITSPALDD